MTLIQESINLYVSGIVKQLKTYIMATMKKPVKEMQKGGTARKKPIVLRPDYRNLQLARSYNNAQLGNKLNTPATKQDSTDYKTGFIRGVKGWKPSADRLKYQGEGEYQKMGRWEGQNAKKEALSKKKTGGKISKAKNGTSLGMKSVKAGFDKNPGVTRADIITAATKKAKNGKPVKKAFLGAIAPLAMKALPMLGGMLGGKGKEGGGGGIGGMLGGLLGKNGKSVKKAKSGTLVKKAQMGSFVTNQGKKGMVAKSGTSMKKCKGGC